jgi:hypothetical protein
MHKLDRFRAAAPCLFLLLPGVVIHAASAPASAVITKAQRQITAYLSQLADLHCTETVTQEKLDGKDHVQASERVRFDYLIMMSGDGDEFQLNESRIAFKEDSRHQAQLPMLVSNGVATLLLAFHPYYRDGFNFEAGSEEMVDGVPALPIHFSHIPGRRSPAALSLRERFYPLDLQGTAWLDEQSGNVLKIDATLSNDMSDVGLRSMSLHVEYKPVVVSGSSTAEVLPALAVVDVTTPRQHWRNTHAFSNYKRFSAEAEQGVNVNVHPDNPNPDAAPAADDKETKKKQ